MERLPAPVLVVTFVLVGFLAGYASADISFPTVTHVYFEKGGVPYNGSVSYTVTCYGRMEYPWVHPVTIAPENTSDGSGIVFTYSASCPLYGCTINEPFYLNYRIIDSCDLTGETAGTKFALKNFSATPLPNCTDLHQFDISKGYGEYYNETPSFTECENRSRKAAELCDNYVVPCSPDADKDCGNWILNDTPVKDSPKSRACREAADRENLACYDLLEKLDPATMIMWKDSRGQDSPAMRICEQHFMIPSSDPGRSPGADPSITGSSPGVPVFVAGDKGLPLPARSPVESLWCTILAFFGGKCA
ncbi:MAG TPA: hypothetical protein VMT44_05515 [Methanoregula sp.]|nr:hypothetical protein [Methanoregula sp.]